MKQNLHVCNKQIHQDTFKFKILKTAIIYTKVPFKENIFTRQPYLQSHKMECNNNVLIQIMKWMPPYWENKYLSTPTLTLTYLIFIENKPHSDVIWYLKREKKEFGKRWIRTRVDHIKKKKKKNYNNGFTIYITEAVD